MRSSLRSPGDTVVSAISRNATTGFLSLSCSMVIFETRRNHASPVARHKDELEAVLNFVDTIFPMDGVFGTDPGYGGEGQQYGLGAMTTAKPRPPLAAGETRAHPGLPPRDLLRFPDIVPPPFPRRQKSILGRAEGV